MRSGTARPPALWLRALPLLLLFAVIAVSFRVGRFPVSTGDVLAVVWATLTGGESGVPPATESIVLAVRLPRVIAGVLVGAALSGAGATYQGMLRNPLVSPDFLGVSAGAGLGAITGICFGWTVMAIQIAAFLGGVLAMAVVYAVARSLRWQDQILVLPLTGLAVGSVLDAGMSIFKVLADPYSQLPTITYWLMGSLNAVTPQDIWAAAPVMLVGLIPLALLRWRMNLLSLGDEEASALGVRTQLMRGLFVLAATLMTSAAVAISGAVGWRGLGWVGLVMPHIARLLVGPDYTRMLPAAMLLGAGFLVAMDSLARSLAVIEIPLSILVSMVGGPFFLWLLTRERRGF